MIIYQFYLSVDPNNYFAIICSIKRVIVDRLLVYYTLIISLLLDMKMIAQKRVYLR